MTDSLGTNTRDILVDFPDWADSTIYFYLESQFAASGSEGFPQKEYSLLLDGDGIGTQTLPVPDNTGDASWLWRIKTPDNNNYRATLAYGSDLQLTTWLASALSTETPATLEDYFVLKTGDTMTGQLNFSGTDHAGIKLISLTTAERDALTPAEGMVIYNETDTVVQVYQGAAWVDYGGGGGGLANVVEDTTPQSGGDWDAQSFNITNVDLLSFDTTPDNAPTNEGEMGWNADFHTFDIKPGFTGVTIQANQEGVILVYNNSGAQIDDGKLVYASGSGGVGGATNILTVALARADAASTSRVLGFATHDIPNDSYGFVSQFGYINDQNTDGITTIAPIWLSDTSAGDYTTSEPQSPSFSVFLGYVVYADLTAGRLFITTLGNTGTNSAGTSTQRIVRAIKASAGTIVKGLPAYIAGYNVGQGVVTVEVANSASAATMPALGITNESITNSVVGEVVVAGRLANIDTSSYSVNQALYVGAGVLTGTRPTGTDLPQKVANVLRSNVNNGVVEVVGAGRTNDIPNFSAVSKFWAADSASATADEKDITDFALSLLDDTTALAATQTLEALPEDAQILSKSGAYQLAAGDEGKIVECNGTFTVTCPNGLDTGFQVTIVNVGSGTITISAATTLQGVGTQLATQYTGAVVYHRGSNVWLAMGKLT